MTRLYAEHPTISVRRDRHGEPEAVYWRDIWYEGASVNHWRIETDWWEETKVVRSFWLFESRDLICEVYREGQEWHLHRVYD